MPEQINANQPAIVNRQPRVMLRPAYIGRDGTVHFGETPAEAAQKARAGTDNKSASCRDH